MLRIVVLGVGTQIGKTWVSAALARSAGPSACIALKPIETGCAPDAPPDAIALAEAAGHPLVPPSYTFPQPVTPWLAAELVGDSIDLERVADWLQHQQSARRGIALHATTCIVETAGGVFSPLTLQETNLDLAGLLDPALWLLVAPNRLGVLHAVRATLEAMRSLHRAPDLLLLNNHGPTDPEDVSTTSNLSLLRRLHPDLPVLGVSTEAPPTLLALRQLLKLD